MKTTIDIPDALLDETRKAAAQDGRTVRSLVEEALRQLLAQRASRAPRRLRDARFYGGGGLTPEYQEKGLMQGIYDDYEERADKLFGPF
jgi:hypothetical protein